MTEINVELLISLVEARPVLWDKTTEEYKNRMKSKRAWIEVFKQLNEEFEEMEYKEREEYARLVQKKWANIRDAFQRSERNLKKSIKSGNTKPNRSYIYGDQLNFLKKVLPQYTDDSFSDIGKYAQTEMSGDLENEDDEVSSSSNTEDNFASGSALRKPEKQKSKKMKVDPVVLELLGLMRRNDRHSSFFAGIIPSLETFDDDDVVEFQLRVLQIVSEIKKRKKTANPAN
ncbi:uncharacterized protein LOC128991474 [Macrosteles quadrilineatus]|uniref:uncharacterized protein LOC128991474 n=1 Tax=Macrosteles quadrilineatus TaxID=74068 RepID=UPI0023E158FD|nr:uncharacterized protein LOC128991474 [Macrosteles quadrilineatus]